MFGRLPDFFQSSEDLHKIWADPETREALLDKMNEAGYGKDILSDIRKLIDAENCDLLDVLEYIAYATTPIERKERAQRLTGYTDHLSDAQKMFIEYMINAYIQSGIDE
jgi:type I restriction enzyme R subunit